MTNSLRDVQKALKSLNQQLPSLSIQRQIDSIESVIPKLPKVALPVLLDETNHLTLASSRLADTIAETRLLDLPTLDSFRDHDTIRRSLDLSTSSHISKLDAEWMTHISLRSQIQLLRIEDRQIGNLLGASETLSESLSEKFNALTSTYREVVTSIASTSTPYSPFIASGTSSEYSFELDAIECVSINQTDKSNCEPLKPVDEELIGFDSQLLDILIGARLSLDSDNPDKARHVTNSIRELVTHIIHALAPNEDVEKWTSDKENYHNGRPTRRARLLYICRHILHDPFVEFVKADVDAALALLDTLHAGTHSKRSNLTQHQLQTIVLRIEQLAIFLIRTSRYSN